MLPDSARCEVSAERGFLPREDPLTRLPESYRVWEELAGDLPKLIPAARVRGLLERMPELSLEGLTGEPELRRAMLLLSYLGHAYVWGEERSVRSLPRALAVPWHEVATRIGRPPILSYASYALDNWRRIDAGGPIALGNLALLQNFLGGADEDWFIAVHIDIERRAAAALREIAPALAACEQEEPEELCGSLERIAAAIRSLVATLLRTPEHCDPYIYYRRVRPFIHGWKDQPSLPDGLIYEGVEAYGGRPQRFRGETGAQSAIVPALDAVLGVAHADDPLRAYLLEMREYMPPAQRSFIESVEGRASVRKRVQQWSAEVPQLGDAYDACLWGLRDFRSTHLDFAARYVHLQSQTASSNPTEIGTGGTPFMHYLRKHRDETLKGKLS